MLLIRIFFLSIIFSFSSAFSISISNVTISTDHHIEEWQSYLDRMTPQELQITANIIFLLSATSVSEQIISQFTTPIARLHQTIRTKIATYQNPTEELTTLKTLLDRLSYVVGARTIYSQTLNTCLASYGKQPVQIIEDAILSIQLYAQTTLRAWAHSKADETSQQLKKCSDLIIDRIQEFHGVSLLHKGMSDGQLPIKIPSEEEVNKSLIILSIILKNNLELLTVTEDVVNALNETTDHAAQIIQVGVEIYKEYYRAIYKKLMSPSCDKKYATTLFSMYDVLPDEYRSLLPDPDHIFEHMLQTVKLYTQTEFLQS